MKNEEEVKPNKKEVDANAPLRGHSADQSDPGKKTESNPDAHGGPQSNMMGELVKPEDLNKVPMGGVPDNSIHQAVAGTGSEAGLKDKAAFNAKVDSNTEPTEKKI